MEYHLMFVWKQEVIFCFGSYLSQKLMDFASIWVILKAKSCWATISEYIRNPNMKLNEYGISEYAKNPYPLDALSAGGKERKRPELTSPQTFSYERHFGTVGLGQGGDSIAFNFIALIIAPNSSKY